MCFDLIKASLGALVLFYFYTILSAKHSINYGNIVTGKKKRVWFLKRLRVTIGYKTKPAKNIKFALK
jgi:hypothetical protein